MPLARLMQEQERTLSFRHAAVVLSGCQSIHGLPVDRDRDFVHPLIVAFIRQTSEK